MAHTLHRWIGLSAILIATVGCTESSITVPNLPTVPAMQEVAGDTIVLDNDLVIIEVERGTEGEPAVRGQRATISYTLWLEDGTGIDQGEDLSFTIGTVRAADRVIAGVSDGVEGMRAGGMRRLIVPPELGYGEEGSGRVPGDATLVFDITLHDVGPRH